MYMSKPFTKTVRINLTLALHVATLPLQFHLFESDAFEHTRSESLLSWRRIAVFWKLQNNNFYSIWTWNRTNLRSKVRLALLESIKVLAVGRKADDHECYCCWCLNVESISFNGSHRDHYLNFLGVVGMTRCFSFADCGDCKFNLHTELPSRPNSHDQVKLFSADIWVSLNLNFFLRNLKLIGEFESSAFQSERLLRPAVVFFSR